MVVYMVREECDKRNGEYRENEAGKDRDPLQLGMPSSTLIDSHCIPSHAPDRARPTAAIPLFPPRYGPASFCLAAIYVACLYVARPEPCSPRLSHNQSRRDLWFVPSLLFPRYLRRVRSRLCSRLYNGAVLIGFVRHVGSFMLVSSPPISVALSVLGTAALKPARPALRSVLLSRLSRPCLKKHLRQRRSPQQSTSPPLGAGPLAFACPKTLGTTNPI